MVVSSKVKPQSIGKTLTHTECYTTVIRTLTRFLPIEINGKRTPEVFYGQLVNLVLSNDSLHSVCTYFPNYWGETTIKYHLHKLSMGMLIEASTPLLVENAIQHLQPGKKYECAIDFTHDPYYGKIDEENEKYIIKGQRKKSTYKFYSYVSLSIIEKNEKFTIGILPVEKGVEKVTYVKSLLEMLEKFAIIPQRIYMDSGFYAIDIMIYLQMKEIPFVIPVPMIRGELTTKVNNLTESCRFSYDVGKSNPADRRVTIDVGVLLQDISQDPKRKKDRVVFALYKTDDWSLNKIARKYQHRFSIEATYRLRNQIKPKTTTKNPVIRYLFALISFVLENIWVHFQLVFCRFEIDDVIVIRKDKLTLTNFKNLLHEKLREIIGYQIEMKFD